MRGTWKRATNVPAGMTDEDALRAMVDVHKRGAALLGQHGKYAIYSEHLADTNATQQAFIFEELASSGYMRFYEGFVPTVAYVDAVLGETQRSGSVPPLPVVLHTGASATHDGLAAFHIIRANHSYFMASNGWLDAGWAWHPEYDTEVGEPLGPARTVDSAEGRLYVRNFTKVDVTLDCRPSNHSATCHAPLPGVRSGAARNWSCSIFHCTCQCFADYYGTHAGRGFGCVDPEGPAADWWRANHCDAQANCDCCKGPGCALPGAAPCVCPHGTGRAPAHCRGTIDTKTERMPLKGDDAASPPVRCSPNSAPVEFCPTGAPCPTCEDMNRVRH